MKELVDSVTIRRVVKLGAPAFEVQAGNESVCFGRIDDTFVTLARVFNNEAVSAHAKRRRPSKENHHANGIGTTAACLHLVKAAGPRGITAPAIMKRLKGRTPLKTISAALCHLLKRHLVERRRNTVAGGPIVWVPSTRNQ